MNIELAFLAAVEKKIDLVFARRTLDHPVRIRKQNFLKHRTFADQKVGKFFYFDANGLVDQSVGGNFWLLGNGNGRRTAVWKRKLVSLEGCAWAAGTWTAARTVRVGCETRWAFKRAGGLAMRDIEVG